MSFLIGAFAAVVAMFGIGSFALHVALKRILG